MPRPPTLVLLRSSLIPRSSHRAPLPQCCIRTFTQSLYPQAQWDSSLNRKSAPNPPSAMHGTDLPPRPKSSPVSLRKYIFSTDFLLRGLYRSLLIAVIVIPILVIWDGPIKTNHVDGEYEAFDLVERQEIAPGHSYFVLKRKKPERYWWAWYEKERPEPV